MPLDVVKLAEDQVNRLGVVGRVLSVRATSPGCETPKLVIQWAKTVPMLMGLWWRLTPGLDLGSIGLGAEDAAPAEVRRGKAMITRVYAEETVSLVKDFRDKATVSLQGLPRPTRNRVLFYFDREIDEVSRIFRI